VVLAEEGCFDRSEASHAVSLRDMHAKYADVIPTAEIMGYPQTCSIVGTAFLESEPTDIILRSCCQVVAVCEYFRRHPFGGSTRPKTA
jgi:hypothetical protein